MDGEAEMPCPATLPEYKAPNWSRWEYKGKYKYKYEYKYSWLRWGKNTCQAFPGKTRTLAAKLSNRHVWGLLVIHIQTRINMQKNCCIIQDFTNTWIRPAAILTKTITFSLCNSTGALRSSCINSWLQLAGGELKGTSSASIVGAGYEREREGGAIKCKAFVVHLRLKVNMGNFMQVSPRFGNPLCYITMMLW